MPQAYSRHMQRCIRVVLFFATLECERSLYFRQMAAGAGCRKQRVFKAFLVSFCISKGSQRCIRFVFPKANVRIRLCIREDTARSCPFPSRLSYVPHKKAAKKQVENYSPPCSCKNLFIKYCCPFPVTTVVLVILTLPSGLLTVRSFTSNSFISMLRCVGIL